MQSMIEPYRGKARLCAEGLAAQESSLGNPSGVSEPVTFTVDTTGDFSLTAAPTSARVIAGDQTSVNIAAGGSGSFTSLVSLSVSTPPGGITAGFSPSNFVAPGASAFVNFALAGTVAPGTYSFTVTGQAQVDGRSVTRTAAFALEVLAPDTLAVTGRVLTAEAVPQPIPGVTRPPARTCCGSTAGAPRRRTPSTRPSR